MRVGWFDTAALTMVAGLTSALAVALPAGAAAQEAPAAVAAPATADGAQQQLFTPADFARFAPRSALDMVEKIPDFTLTEVSEDRGLGQASENVLVNGQRVAGKTNDARTILSRIAAASVERIEIADGSRLGIPGLTGKVANVIVKSAGLQVQFRWDAQARANIPDQLTTGSISASGRTGQTDYTLSLSNSNASRRGGLGPEIVTDAAGAILLLRTERNLYASDTPRLAGSLHRDMADGSILNLNLSGEREFFRVRFDGYSNPPSGSPITDERYRNRSDNWSIEGGGDYETPLGAGRLKLIGLQRYISGPVESRSFATVRAPGAVTRGVRFLQTGDEGESVLRGEYVFGGGRWQASIEGAYNFVDITSTFARLAPDGTLVSVPLAGGTTFVDEWRGEALLSRSTTLAPGLTVQTVAGAEISRIRQTSAGGLSRQFIRPKGSAALAWTASRRLTVNASVKREVGQLDFYDFSAAVDVENGLASSGNVALVPEQTWRVDGEVIRSLGSAGSVTLGAYHAWITDIVDRVPLSATEEGVGNLPSARRWGGTARGTLLLDTLGWHGGRLNANIELRQSRVRDPVTGEARRISSDLLRKWSVDVRHDIPRTPIAWGASLSEERYGTFYRLDQTSRSFLTQPISVVFVEHKDVYGLTVRLGLRNVLNGHDDIRRNYYVARRDGPIETRERQLRYIHRVGTLSISGTF